MGKTNQNSSQSEGHYDPYDYVMSNTMDLATNYVPSGTSLVDRELYNVPNSTENNLDENGIDPNLSNQKREIDCTQHFDLYSIEDADDFVLESTKVEGKPTGLELATSNPKAKKNRSKRERKQKKLNKRLYEVFVFLLLVQISLILESSTEIKDTLSSSGIIITYYLFFRDKS